MSKKIERKVRVIILDIDEFPSDYPFWARLKIDKKREKIYPNPDKTKKDPMYLKGPRSIPKNLVKPHNKHLVMPKHLKERYSKNKK